ncbi:hypothetical protein QCD69_22415, partial [Erwinia sp. PsM31]|nr:hypothetical protein [Erwinia sp. PsM31]
MYLECIFCTSGVHEKKCDDDAYGYFIGFKKVIGKTILYNFTFWFDSLLVGNLSCKAAINSCRKKACEKRWLFIQLLPGMKRRIYCLQENFRNSLQKHFPR